MIRHVRKTKYHKFHIRYKWAGLFILVVGVLLTWLGIEEVGKLSMGLAFESFLHHVIEFAADVE